MRRFRKTTIKEVAQQAGVSTTTVSIFVSGREDVCAPATAERIRAAVKSLHYTPSSLVRSMQQRATSTIGVCMFSPLDPVVSYGNPFFERLWRGILSQADHENYSLLHYPASVRDSPDSCDAFLDGRVDGVLFHAHSLDNRRPSWLSAAGMPTVLLTRSENLPDGCGAAYVDEYQTADLALSHLWNLGHRRIGHIAGPIDNETLLERGVTVDDIARQRLAGYSDWMRTRGVYDVGLVRYAQGWKGDRVPEIVSEWARSKDRPTAIFCANDALALKVISAAQHGGWSVPQRLSVVGVDNSAAGREYAIPLTSIEAPVEDVGREGIRALVRLMHNAPIEECRIALSTSTIVTRSSTAAAYAERQ